MHFAVLCTGPSMSQAVADAVRHLRVVAVNNTYQLAPWAEALAANDAAWWARNPEAKKFAGRKFSTNRITGVEQVKSPNVSSPYCSGVVALEVARQLGATRVLLLGADFHGSHFFGDYTDGLKNTTEARRKTHANQFKLWGRANPQLEVWNCTAGSQLGCFPKMDLQEALDACATQSLVA